MVDQPIPKIRIRGLTKTFGDQTVLAGLDLDIQAGDHVILLGASGSGKTVLLKCILGLLEADAGSIWIDDEETINRPPTAREALMRKIGVLFQNGALFDSLPVWQNITFGFADWRQLDPAEARAVAIEKLADVGLAPDVIDLYPDQLSGGMQKRVAFARAVVSDPEILLLDSPTAGLDPRSGSHPHHDRQSTDGLGDRQVAGDRPYDHARYGQRSPDRGSRSFAPRRENCLGGPDDSHRSLRQSAHGGVRFSERGAASFRLNHERAFLQQLSAVMIPIGAVSAAAKRNSSRQQDHDRDDECYESKGGHGTFAGWQLLKAPS